MEENKADWLDRTRMLLGEEAVHILQEARVAVIGLGGVGAAAAEGLCRAGVGHLMLMDHDVISITNGNRQLIALSSNVGEEKCIAAAKRMRDIAPEAEILPQNVFFSPETEACLFDFRPGFVVDAIDTVSSKLFLAQRCQEKGIALVSSMGTGNRLDPSRFTIGDIQDTAGCGCGLAKVMRRELKKRGITSLPVVYSTEMPRTVTMEEHGRHAPASISFCPPVAGFLLAGYVVRRLIGIA